MSKRSDNGIHLHRSRTMDNLVVERLDFAVPCIARDRQRAELASRWIGARRLTMAVGLNIVDRRQRGDGGEQLCVVKEESLDDRRGMHVSILRTRLIEMFRSSRQQKFRKCLGCALPYRAHPQQK